MQQFGYPPKFPSDLEQEKQTITTTDDGDVKIEDKSKSKKVCQMIFFSVV